MDRKTFSPLSFSMPIQAKTNSRNSLDLEMSKWSKPFRKLLLPMTLGPGLWIFLLGFLLGRASILEELAPFSVAYFAVIHHLKRDRAHIAFVGLLLGSLFSMIPHPGLVVAGIAAYLLLQRLLVVLSRYDLSTLPFLVLVSAFTGGLANLYLQTAPITLYSLAMRGVEAVLAMVLTFIFIQSLPLFLHRREPLQLKQEETISLFILFASVMTGTVGWMIEGYSVENMLSRYLILLMALVGGGALGATVGVVTGLILSMADVRAITQMSLLGFSGLLAGLFREGRRIGVSIGVVIGTSILTIYAGERTELWTSLVETMVALFLFWITPQSLISELARYVPGTQEHLKSQQEYVQKVRKMTAERVSQFSEVFRQLAKSFAQTSWIPDNKEEMKADYFLSGVTDQTCQQCWKKEICWSKQFDFTYHHMREMMDLLEQHREIPKRKLNKDWQNTCVRLDKLIRSMEEEYRQRQQEERLNKKIREARHLVADQLQGVARVMRDFSLEIQKEGQELGWQEQQIMRALESLGLKIQGVEILNLEPGMVEIRIAHPGCAGTEECKKIIAPMLSEILDEPIVVSDKGCRWGDGGCLIHLVSGKEFQVHIGVAQAAKGGGLISGDSYTSLDLGNGKYAVAISDGMGNGSRAYTESSATVNLLQQILQSGLDENLAIKTVNTVLSLRSTDEVFATVDLAIIDLHDADTKFIKIGSAPSFIKRFDQVRTVHAHNLPIGILDEIEVDVVNERLRSGDLLIMITDGIYDANRNVENKDTWLKRIIGEIESHDPQVVADLLLERVIRSMHNQIADDMTVLVAKIDRYQPKWSTFSLPEIPKIDRARISQSARN